MIACIANLLENRNFKHRDDFPVSLGRAARWYVILFQDIRLFAALPAMIPRNQRVDRGRHEQRENRTDAHARRNDDSDCEAALRTGTLGDNQGNHSRHHGRRGHENGPQPHGGGMFDRLKAAKTFLLLKLVGEFHHQNTVFGNETDQRDEPDLRIDIHARRAHNSKDDSKAEARRTSTSASR